MTREDAIFFLNELRSANNCDETIDMAIAALREPVLDENGLARCGCGGEPKMLDIKRPYADKGFWVECQGCGITIGPCDSPTIAIIAFNQAMGVKGADE